MCQDFREGSYSGTFIVCLGESRSKILEDSRAEAETMVRNAVLAMKQGWTEPTPEVRLGEARLGCWSGYEPFG